MKHILLRRAGPKAFEKNEPQVFRYSDNGCLDASGRWARPGTTHQPSLITSERSSCASVLLKTGNHLFHVQQDSSDTGLSDVATRSQQGHRLGKGESWESL
eukprot:11117913-Alexandrium_andersonii.AAC.1